MKSKKRIRLVSGINLLFLLFIIACSSKDKGNEPECIDDNLIDENSVCIEIYDPVCGCNNITYSNSCYASINGVVDYTSGRCD
ncbi:hypothetical protein OAF23_00525 [Flavobacteriaceae bacterium]|nr:hypothetical protein [Flavobacteriaceae bacterium]